MRGTIPGYLRPHVERIEAYSREMNLDVYLRSSGERTMSDHAIHGRYPELNDARLFRMALDAGDIAYARALLNMCLMARLVDANDRLAAERLKVTVRLSGEDVGVGRALAAWRTAASEPERELAAEALTPGLTMLAAAQRRWLDDYDSVRHGLGFDTQADLIRAVHEDVTGWLRNAERSLEETRESFVREHAEWRRRDGRGDSPTMVAIPVSNVPVPSGAAGSEAAVRGTVSAWGFPDEAARIPIDLVPRPGKLAGALCGRIDPPRDVRVTGQPTGGSLEYALMLHEFGHGLHFTIGPDRAFDMFGDDQGITEGFGRTFETVARQPRWFELFVGITLGEEAAARLHFNAVMSARLDAVQVLYEHRLSPARSIPSRSTSTHIGGRSALRCRRTSR